MEEEDDDWVLGWTMIDLSDPPVKRAAAISKKLGFSIDDFIEQAIVEKVARWDAEQGSKLAAWSLITCAFEPPGLLDRWVGRDDNISLGLNDRR